MEHEWVGRDRQKVCEYCECQQTSASANAPCRDRKNGVELAERAEWAEIQRKLKRFKYLRNKYGGGV